MNQASPSRSRVPRPDPYQQIRDSALALVTEGQHEEATEYALEALQAVLRRNRELELLVLKYRRAQMGQTSERLDSKQLMLLFEELKELGEVEPDTQEQDAREEAKLDQEIAEAEAELPEAAKRKRRKRGDWSTRGTGRETHQLEPSLDELACPSCGNDKTRIGSDVTRRLEFVPASFVEHEYHLIKYACSKCKNSVTTALAPPQVLERSAAGASLLAHIVVSKFADHCPLTRLNRVYERLGASIPVSTLADWVSGVGQLIEPITDRLAELVRESFLLGFDASGLKVLDPSTPENIQRGTMWCYVGDRKNVVFRYTPTGEGASGPWAFLKGRTGYIQADAANVHDRLFNGQAASAVEVGCLAHARRKLFDLLDSDARVAYPLKQIRQLYRVEKLADARRVGPDERLALRLERSQHYLDKLKRWLVRTLAKEPPAAQLAKASKYFINHWEALTRFISDGRLGLDNNIVESQIRDLALGRKNYLFAGSHKAAERTAALYGILRTCALHGVKPLPYLTDILDKLAGGWKQARLDELLPQRWQELHAPGTQASLP